MAPRRTPKQKIIEAALKLAETKKWPEISMTEIARAAKVSLAQMRGEFSGKSAILKAFMAQIDQVVLDQAAEDVVDEEPRDRLFDIIMLRFEALEPYKAALNNIIPSLRLHPTMALELSGAILRSAKWMLIAAGLETHGSAAFVRTRGLALVFGKTMEVWLVDEDAGLAKTMAELDKQLRRGEDWLKALRGPLGLLNVCAGFAQAFASTCSKRNGKKTDGEAVPQA
jgi:AcrR family transcriptional regulator